MKDTKDPIKKIQEEEVKAKKLVAKKETDVEADFVNKKTEFENQLGELKENLRKEGTEKLQKAKEEAAKRFKDAQAQGQKSLSSKVREFENRKDQAVSIIEKTFEEFIKA
jgi:hypothetical protein